MKKIFLSTFLLSCCLCARSLAQSGIISTVDCNGTPGFSGDGGPALSAQLYVPCRLAIDAAGNHYISDNANARIRKVNTSGIITTFAGGGSGPLGDGGPATAGSINSPQGIIADAAGNIYFAELGNARLRKVSASGIISTFAGDGSGTASGDGGPATAAGVGPLNGVAMDAAGNIYITGQLGFIRKINTSGIISTIAGTGVNGFSGDGGPATAADFDHPTELAIDAANNIYVSDGLNDRIRKIDASGIVTTIAGNGVYANTGDGGPAIAAGIRSPQGIAIDAYGNLLIGCTGAVRSVSPAGIITTIAGTNIMGYSGDGGPATAAMIGSAAGVTCDASGHVYEVDEGYSTIRMFSVYPNYASDSFSVNLSKNCSGINLGVAVNHYSSGMSVVTYFGDGTNSTTTIPGPTGSVLISHTYTYNSTYTVKQVLLKSGARIDSVSFSCVFQGCNSIHVNFYNDMNLSCLYEPSVDQHVYSPITVEIDSNGHPVDTLTTPGALNYDAYGVTGDVYTVKVLSYSAGLTLSCPSSGTVYDTIQMAPYTSFNNDIGFVCSSSTPVDLQVHAVTNAGRRSFGADIVVDNLSCTPQNATITVALSPKYDYTGATMPPTSTAANVATFDFAGLSATGPLYLHVSGSSVGGVSYTMGDTANSDYLVSPTTGDANPTDNHEHYVDVISGSYDPNFIEVVPAGCITSAVTQLQYAIGFENTGNAPAENIFLMDTLPATLDASTIKVVTASHDMTFTKIKYGTQTIVRFEFPNIMLPDSSHHNECHGMVMYTVKTRAGLLSSTAINNRAGIYFDTNPVVLTNNAFNMVNCSKTPPPHVNGLPVTTVTGLSIFPNPAQDKVNISAGYKIRSVVIANLVGQEVLSEQYDSENVSVGITELPKGIFFVKINGHDIRKFVKE